MTAGHVGSLFASPAYSKGAHIGRVVFSSNPANMGADRYLEIFLVNSWAEHLRQHERQTQADRKVEQRLSGYVDADPEVRHLIYANSTETACKLRPPWKLKYGRKDKRSPERLRSAFRQDRQNGAILSKCGSDLGLVSRVKELLRGSGTGCQYR